MSEAVVKELINPRRTPLKGEPNFTAVSDEKLKEYRELVQDLIFAYKHCDKEICAAMQKAHKHIVDNLTNRITYDTITASDTPICITKKEEVSVQKKFQKPKKIKLVKSI